MFRKLRRRLAYWLYPDAFEQAKRYCFLHNHVAEALRWLSQSSEGQDVARWLLERDRNHWRELGTPYRGELPVGIENLREMFRRRRTTVRRILAKSKAEWSATHRHKKRGSYYMATVTGQLQASNGPVEEGTALMAYVSEEGQVWFRPVDEFRDGRFEQLSRS